MSEIMNSSPAGVPHSAPTAWPVDPTLKLVVQPWSGLELRAE